MRSFVSDGSDMALITPQGIHKGDANDPRVSLIEVVPCEIRYWVSTQNSITKTVTMAVSSLTGKGTAPGELRIITGNEVRTFCHPV